jgi:hypothetical protein
MNTIYEKDNGLLEARNRRDVRYARLLYDDDIEADAKWSKEAALNACLQQSSEAFKMLQAIRDYENPGTLPDRLANFMADCIECYKLERTAIGASAHTNYAYQSFSRRDMVSRLHSGCDEDVCPHCGGEL